MPIPTFPSPRQAIPPTYTALLLHGALYVEYSDTGEVSYYAMTAVPSALQNIAATLSEAKLQALHAALLANYTCSGMVQCRAAQSLTLWRVSRP